MSQSSMLQSNFLEEWKKEGKSPDVIIVDPPRAGMHPDAPGILRDFSPKEIIYVSCNPATLVRDIALIARQMGNIVSQISHQWICFLILIT